jgi:hypothetical protein
VDGVVLSTALGTEHYDLQQEQHTSEELNVAAKKVAATATFSRPFGHD